MCLVHQVMEVAICLINRRNTGRAGPFSMLDIALILDSNVWVSTSRLTIDVLTETSHTCQLFHVKGQPCIHCFTNNPGQGHMARAFPVIQGLPSTANIAVATRKPYLVYVLFAVPVFPIVWIPFGSC
jgi:hypothetical protein